MWSSYPEPISLYSLSLAVQELVCGLFSCVKASHGDHDLCSYRQLPAAVVEHRDKLRTGVASVEESTVASINNAIVHVNERRDTTLSAIEVARKSIKAVAAQRIALVNEMLEKELKRIHEYEVSCRHTCDLRVNDFTNRRSSVQQAMAFASKLADVCCDEEVMALAKPVTQALADIRDKPTHAKPPALGRIQHDEVDDDEVRLSNMLGDMSIIHIGGRFSTSDVPRRRDGTIQASSGHSYTMTVTTRTSDGSVTAAGGDIVKATWTKVPGQVQEEPPEVAVTDNENGTYTLTYTMAKEGRYKLNVAVNGDSISDSPFDFNTLSSSWHMDPNQCGKGIEFEKEYNLATKAVLGHTSILGTVGWDTGVHKWTIRISSKANCYAGVSFRDEDAMTWRGSRSNPAVWCFSTNGYKYSDQGQVSTVLGKDDCATELTLDCENHTLTMKNEDDSDEEVIENLPAEKTFFPWFHLYYNKSFVQIMSV